jgi:hypothetical protein
MSRLPSGIGLMAGVWALAALHRVASARTRSLFMIDMSKNGLP